MELNNSSYLVLLKFISITKKCSNKIVPAGFEPASSAPKAGRIDHYPTGLHWLAE